MTTKTQMVIDALSQELRIPKEGVLEQGLKAFLERNLREIKVEIFHITGKPVSYTHLTLPTNREV